MCVCCVHWARAHAFVRLNNESIIVIVFVFASSRCSCVLLSASVVAQALGIDARRHFFTFHFTAAGRPSRALCFVCLHSQMRLSRCSLESQTPLDLLAPAMLVALFTLFVALVKSVALQVEFQQGVSYNSSRCAMNEFCSLISTVSCKNGTRIRAHVLDNKKT